MMRVSLSVLIVGVILLCFDISSFCDALKAGEKGVCVSKTPIRRTRIKTYFVTTGKYCGAKKCLVKKTKKEAYTIQKVTPVCCSGWKYSSDTKKCAPICRGGCDGGRCEAPERCVCDAPLVLDPTTINCKSCNTSCHNAVCTANNTCSCIANHSVLNATHCAPTCSPGYHNDPTTLLCEPRCEKPCKNGICTAPDVCSCNAGYELNIVDKYSCMPSCEPLCQNATCISPNECSCMAGYEKIDNFICQPTCESCENGQCISPGKCACNEGYVKSDEMSVCVPKCESCTHGDCIGPNNCSCHNGYFMSGGECKPICKENCTNGVCISPGTCVCKEGYQKNFDYCVKSCLNGNYSASGSCTCFDGYTKNETDPNACHRSCVCCKGTCDLNGESSVNAGNETCATVTE